MTVVVRRLPERPSEYGGRLGRHVEHDERSRAYAIVRSGTPTLVNVTHPRRGRIFDQGDLGSCTGNAMAAWLNTVPAVRAHGPARLRRERDAVRIYSAATSIDEFDGAYPPDDTGSSGLAVAKVALDHGWIGEYRHAFSLDDAVQALQTYAVLTGVEWRTGFDRPDDRGIVHLSGSVRGGHEFLIRGIELASTNEPLLDALLLADNSWSSDWGRRGSFLFTVREWGELLDAHGDTCHLDLDLGFGFRVAAYTLDDRPVLSCRIWGINAPEIATDAGKAALVAAETIAPPGAIVSVVSHGWDKYGGRFDGSLALPDGSDFAAKMLDGGYAVVMKG